MRRILPLIFWQFGLLAGGPAFADVVTLKDGRQISGLVESGNIQELHIKVGDQSQTIDIHQVQAIQFGVSLPAPPAAPPPPKAADLAPEPAPAAAPPALKAGAPLRAAPQPPTSAPAGTITLGIGAEIAVRTMDSTALTFAGKGLENAPETPFTNRLTQPAIINSQRGRQ